MRLNHLDILEQCFREKFKGYSKQEVDTFLHLVADDFKDMSDEIEQLKREVAQKNRIIEKQKEKKSAEPEPPKFNPEITQDFLRKKAKEVIRVARSHAENHKKQAERELDVLKKEIHVLTTKKLNLINNLKESAREHLKRNIR